MGEPLSRVEAILQNILGADNILVPPGSQVEEILQAIYYNTEYEKNPESRVAEILLAIKNKGIYDGPVLSRMEDILVHKLNNIPYTKHKKEDLSRVEQLLLDWLEQSPTPKTQVLGTKNREIYVTSNNEVYVLRG